MFKYYFCSFYLFFNKFYKQLYFVFILYILKIFLSYTNTIFFKHVLKYLFIFIFLYLFFSIFINLNKTYQYDKYTSHTQRFWKRSFILFWIIEFYLFFLFIFLTLTHFNESTYFLDWTGLSLFVLPNFKPFLFNNVLILIIIFLFYTLLFLKKNNNVFLENVLLYFTFIFLILLLTDEFSKFFYSINYYKDTDLFLDFYLSKKKRFSAFTELEIINKTRTLRHYLFLFVILKFWHVFFIIFYFYFFFLKKCETNKISFDILSSNLINILYLFIFNVLTYILLLKFLLKIQIKNVYYWFFININYMDILYNLYYSFSFNFFFTMFKPLQVFSIKNILKNLMIFFNDSVKFFFKKYIYTINHKRIALNYLYFSFFSGLSGTFLATIIRAELSYPGSHFFKGDSIKYLQVITSHGLIMIFFVVIPIIFGFFANFFIPYHIGSKDVAFPRLNSIGFWILFSGFILLSKPAFLRRQMYKYHDNPTYYYSFLWNNIKNNSITNYYNFYKPTYKNNEVDMNKVVKVKDEPNLTPKLLTKNMNNFFENNWTYFFNSNISQKRKTTFVVQCPNATLTMSGWTFITPFSAKLKYTGFGAQDIAIISVVFAGISTTISFTNLLITRRTLSMPGLRNRKTLLPFLSINLFLVMRMLALITPVLGAAMIMLQLDRHWGFSFFDYSYGGDPVLFHHLFWFFGHPEVYVVILPAFGIISMLLPFSNSKRLTSKNHLIWATYIMAYMGFLVWGHHMYLIGLDHRSRSLYSTITVMISLPAVVKLVNWTLTILNGSFKWDVSVLFCFAFLLFFLCGGLTGLWLSHVGLNVYVHDTFYVVAHFHFLFSSATFSAIFAGIYYYFGVIFGIKYSKFFAYTHLFYWFVGQWLTFLPLFWIGYNGLPRRYHDYPLIFMGWHGLSTAGHILTLISIVMFFFMLLDSHILNKNYYINNFYIPRWHNRINYYQFKIKYIQFYNKKSNLIGINKFFSCLQLLYSFFFTSKLM